MVKGIDIRRVNKSGLLLPLARVMIIILEPLSLTVLGALH